MWKVIDPLRDRRTYAGWVFALLGLGLRTRRGCVSLANRFLGTGMPPPTSDPQWSSRVRTGLWFVIHAATGGALVLVTGLLVVTALLLPRMWLNGGDTLTFLFTDIPVPGGVAGLWTIPAAAGLVLLAIYATAASAAGWRWLAPRFLGPDATEKLAAVERRADDLARRNRLARELHDSIGHTLTASTIQAAVASQLMESDPESARAALTTIEESSRHALDDLDHVLGVLREDAGAREPERTLTDLGPLLDRLAATGTTVRRQLDERMLDVPATVSRAAFRVAQEAVTNALRHAPDQPVDVTVTIGEGELRLEVTNPLPPAATGQERGTARRAGRGLRGAAERVRLLDGEFAAGADTGAARWVLSASLPWQRPVHITVGE